MAETENIGSVSVSIFGDYSQLSQDFDAAVAIAVKEGATLAEAINKAYDSINVAPLTEAFTGVGTAATKAAEQLSLFDQAAHVDFADATGQLNLFTTEMERLGPAAGAAAVGVVKLPDEIKQIGDEAATSTQKLSDLLGPLLRISGYSLSIGGLVALGGDALSAFGDLQKADIALTAITGDVNAAGAAIEGLKTLALDDALSFPSLLTANLRLTEFRIEADAIPGALNAIADAAAATNRSFDTVANSFERIVESGVVMNRTLVNLGLSTQDMADAMGVSVDEVKKVFAELEPSLRAEVLTQALAGLAGTAKETAAGILGQWQTFKTEFLFLLQDIGKGLEDSASGFLKWAGSVASYFDAAVKAANQASADMKTASDNFDANLQKLSNQVPLSTGYGGKLPEGYGTVQTTTSRSKEDIDADIKAITDLDAATVAAEAHATALYAAYAQLGVVNFSGLTKAITDEAGNITKLSDLQAFQSLADTIGGPRIVQAADTLEAKLKQAFDAGAISAQQFETYQDQIEQKLNDLRDAGQNLGETLHTAFVAPAEGGFTGLDGQVVKLSTDLDDAQAHLAKFNDLSRELSTSVDSTGFALLKSTMDAIGVDVGNLDSGLSQAASEAGALGGLLLSTSQEMPKFYAPLIKAEKDWVDSAILDQQALLKAMHVRADDDLATTLANNAKIQASDSFTATEKLKSQQNADKAILADTQQYRVLQQDILTTEIAVAAERGTDATAYIEQLTQLNYQTKALADASANLGNVYKGLRTDFDAVFASLSKGLADAIVNGKSLGDVFITVGKQIASSILDTIIKGALVPLQDELNKTGGLFDSLAKSITGSLGSAQKSLEGLGLGPPGGTGSVGDIAGGANAGLPGGPLGTLDTSQGGSTPIGGDTSGSGASSLLGGIGGLVPVLGVAIQAISGIVQGFQMAHLENLLGEVEVTTRGMLNVLALNGEDSILGATIHTWQELVTMSQQLSDLHDDNVLILGKFDELVAAIGVGGGGGGSGGGGGGADLSGLMTVFDDLTSTITTFRNSLVFGAGGGTPVPGFASVTGTQAYTLPYPVSTSDQGFSAIPNPQNLSAQALSAFAPQSSAQVGSNETFSGAPNESGAALGTSTGGAAFAGLGNVDTGSILQTALKQAGINPQLANRGAYDAIEAAYEQRFAIPSGGWGPYFESIGIPKTSIPSNLYNAGYVTTGFQPNYSVNPDDLLGPTPSSLIPSTPMPSYNTGGGSFGGGGGSGGSAGYATVTVNALMNTPKDLVGGIITGLRQVGVKVA